MIVVDFDGLMIVYAHVFEGQIVNGFTFLAEIQEEFDQTTFYVASGWRSSHPRRTGTHFELGIDIVDLFIIGTSSVGLVELMSDFFQFFIYFVLFTQKLVQVVQTHLIPVPEL